MREEVPVVGKHMFQYPKATDSKTNRKGRLDLTDYRKSELQEYPWVENEWHGLAVGEERRKPINRRKEWDPELVPHLRERNDRPFDASRVKMDLEPFGPKSMYESVHYGGDKLE